MSEPTTRPEEPAAAPLLPGLLELLAAFRSALRQERPYRRGVALVFGSLFAFARHTLSQRLLALGVTEQEWSAWYRRFSLPRVALEALSAELVRQTLAEIPAGGPYVVAVDGVQVPRWSLTLPGTSWLQAPRTPRWQPGIHRAQRFFHLAALLPSTRQGYSRALPLRWVLAAPPKAVPARTPPRTEGQAAGAELGWLRRQVDAAGRAAQALLAVGDGSYDTAELWTHRPPRTTLLARCAKHRALVRLPEPTPRPRRGAPRKYGARAGAAGLAARADRLAASGHPGAWAADPAALPGRGAVPGQAGADPPAVPAGGGRGPAPAGATRADLLARRGRADRRRRLDPAAPGARAARLGLAALGDRGLPPRAQSRLRPRRAPVLEPHRHRGRDRLAGLGLCRPRPRRRPRLGP